MHVLLYEWYGGGPSLPRLAISEGDALHKQVIVEVYPLRLSVYGPTSSSSSKLYTISKMCTVWKLKQEIAASLQTNPDRVRLWNYDKCVRYIHFTNYLISHLTEHIVEMKEEKSYMLAREIQ